MNTPTQQPSPVAAELDDVERAVRYAIDYVDTHHVVTRIFNELRAALASRSQEPDAWMVICGDLREAFRERLDARRYAAECLQKFGVACEIKPLYLAPQGAAAQGWLPIESAPTKGRDLILLLTPSGFPQVAYSNTWWTAGFSVECKPTHWMPLPAPSASAPTGEAGK